MTTMIEYNGKKRFFYHLERHGIIMDEEEMPNTEELSEPVVAAIKNMLNGKMEEIAASDRHPSFGVYRPYGDEIILSGENLGRFATIIDNCGTIGKQLTSRYAGTCDLSSLDFEVGEEIYYYKNRGGTTTVLVSSYNKLVE